MGKVLDQPIKVFDFAKVVSEKRLKGSGFKFGDEVLVMSSKDVAFKKDDPYLKRTLFIVSKVVDGVVQTPGEGNDFKGYVLDPRSLEKVSEERSTELHKQFE